MKFVQNGHDQNDKAGEGHRPNFFQRLIYGDRIAHFPVSEADPAPLPDEDIQRETEALIEQRDEELLKLREATNSIRSNSLRSLTAGVLLEFKRR